MATQLFEGNFYVKDGRAVGKRADGNIANFDEALSILVDESAFKDNILKSTSGGSGGNDAKSILSGSGKGKLTYEEAARLSPKDYAQARKDGKI